jgi:hypothetical protein
LVRYLLFAVEVTAATAAVLAFVVWPQLRRLRDRELAQWVEARASRLDDRLVTAVELNLPGARTEGMSAELIAVVTHEAEKHAAHINFARVADHRRLRWAAAVLAPALVVALVPLLLAPQLSLALLERQALLDVEVPRLVRLESDTDSVLPVGEKFQIVYRVSGPVDETTTGALVVAPEGQPRERYELKFLKRLGDGKTLFKVDMPPMTADLTYTARLADGRSRRPSELRFVARPVVTRQEAFVLLPAYCGLTPDGQRYFQAQQGHGDVVGIPGSDVRVVIQASKPIKCAKLELLGPEHFDPQRTDDELVAEVVKDTVPLTLGTEIAGTFKLRPELTAYRVVVADEYGFVNVPAPRRSVRQVPEEPPQVMLLKDYFGPDADSDVDGIPVPIGKAIRIPYIAHGPYGLGQARILYRVVKKMESGNDVVEPGPWTVLPLPEVTGRASLGRFDPKRGVFENSQDFDEVPFHAVPSNNPQLLGRQIGGGRFFLQTKGLVSATGEKIALHKGDQVEYCVEVFADRGGDPARPSARSETRVTTVVDASEWRNWLRGVLREEEQLRKLDQEQRGVFGK